jgi:hypothetical protein
VSKKGASPMWATWTSKPPRRQGYYWNRSTRLELADCPPMIVEVAKGRAGLFVLFHGSDHEGSVHEEQVEWWPESILPPDDGIGEQLGRVVAHLIDEAAQALEVLPALAQERASSCPGVVGVEAGMQVQLFVDTTMRRGATSPERFAVDDAIAPLYEVTDEIGVVVDTSIRTEW